MTDRRVPVALGSRTYEVRIGAGLLSRAGAEIETTVSTINTDPWVARF